MFRPTPLLRTALGAALLTAASACAQVAAPGWTDLQPADRVWAAVRPEKLTVSVQAPVGTRNAWRARVDTALYYGDHREYGHFRAQ